MYMPAQAAQAPAGSSNSFSYGYLSTRVYAMQQMQLAAIL